MAQTKVCRGVATTITTDSYGTTRVVYYQTVVVKWNHNEIILNSGGWETVTTKLRMNQASNQFGLDFYVWQRKGVWWVTYNRKDIPFQDGMTLRRKVYTINEIRETMTADGSHWWDADTMRWFRSRISDRLYQGPGGLFFVSSEKPPNGPRAYSVRKYDPHTQDISTVGEFCSIPTRGIAHRQAKALAKQERG